jgi:hypothetical protein
MAAKSSRNHISKSQDRQPCGFLINLILYGKLGFKLLEQNIQEVD